MTVTYDPPSDEVIERHYRELGVTEETLKRDVATLKAWMEEQPHLPSNVDTATLEKFLIHSKNSLEQAKSKLDLYYTARSTVTDMFHNRDPLDPAIKDISEVAMFCVSPKTTPEGDRVTIVKLFNDDLKRFDILACLKVGLMILDVKLAEDKCRKHVIVFDFEGTSLGHAAAFTIPVIKKAHALFLDVFPQGFHGFHVINSPSYFDKIVTMSTGLLDEEMAQRVYCHGTDLSALHKHVPKDVLPPEYGGTLPLSLEQLRVMSYQLLVDRRDWFLEQNKIHTEEDKRANKESNKLDTILDSSFRKITID